MHINIRNSCFLVNIYFFILIEYFTTNITTMFLFIGEKVAVIMKSKP